jgi:hypothetical protein
MLLERNKLVELLINKTNNRFSKIRRQIQAAIIKLAGNDYQLLYFAYHPDSYVHFSKHQEFLDLAKKFRLGNKKNNSGDYSRLWTFILNCKQLADDQVPGDFAELGVWRGNTAAVLAHFSNIQNRRLFLFDTFTGFKREDLTGIDSHRQPNIFSDTSLDYVKKAFSDVKNISYYKGRFPETVDNFVAERTFALVSLDCDLYAPMSSALEFFYTRLAFGGIILIHDYSSEFWPGVKAAVDSFCSRTNEYVILVPDKSGSAIIRKSRLNKTNQKINDTHYNVTSM